MKKAVVLLSGGLDSSTCLALMRSRDYDCYALSFFYGQRHHAELKAATAVAKALGVRAHQMVDLPMLGEIGHSALTDNSIKVPSYNGSTEIPQTYVPARNTIMLSIALGYAEVVGADCIVLGISAVDYSHYPDCRPEYLAAFQNLAALATKAGVEGRGIQIEAPLLHLSKADTVKLGLSLGLDYSLTCSCYQANTAGEACGNCDSCHFRKKGFIEAGLPDPTRYIK